MTNTIDQEILPSIRSAQQNEITEHFIRLRRRPRTSVRGGRRKKWSPATPDSAPACAKTDEPGEAKREVSRRETKQFSEDGSFYPQLAKNTKDTQNRHILETIAKDEFHHYGYWKSLTKEEMKPVRLIALWHIAVSRIFGLSFGLKLMEKGEAVAAVSFGMGWLVKKLFGVDLQQVATDNRIGN